jgi:hypothetical protein
MEHKLNCKMLNYKTFWKIRKKKLQGLELGEL